MEEEDLPEEAEMEEETEGEVTRPQDPVEDHPPEETPFPPDLTYQLTCDPSPAPTMRDQWENFPTSSTEIELKQRHSSTN